MLKLGHIDYSSCVPVHGRFLEQGPPSGVGLIHGIPTQLNGQLERGEIDVAPASSIEYARRAPHHRILPGLSISADGPVQTIQLLCPRPLDALTREARVGLPTASATSVALLKIIMRQRLGIQPSYGWFEQELIDPFAHGFDAALYIGDVAYRRRSRQGLRAYDLAAIWREWTGLPFVFALWQTTAGPERDAELKQLVGELAASREWSFERLPRLAERYSGEYGWPADHLVDYWRSLEYGWNDKLAAGLREFYRRAAQVGEIEHEAPLNFLEP
jgi:chorismate dehydratase